MLRPFIEKLGSECKSLFGDNPINRTISLLLFALLLFDGFKVSFTDYPEFDGAMNFQVSKNVMQGEGYQTTYQGVKANIQTGPTLILPAALWFKLFGITKFTTHLTNLIYLVALAIVLMRFVARYLLTPPWYVLLVLLTVPHLFTYSLHGFGEAIAAFFTLWGFYMLVPALGGGKRDDLVAGLAFGLAAVTKTLSFVSLGALFVLAVPYSFVAFKDTSRRLLLKRWGVIVSVFVLVPVLFEISKVLQLGWNEYSDELISVLRSIRVHQGFGAVQNSGVSGISERVSQAAAVLGFETHLSGLWIYLFLGAVPLLLVVFSVRNLPKASAFLVSCLTVYFLMGLVWWHFLTGQQWWRRLFQFYLLLIPGMAYVVYTLLTRLRELVKRKSRHSEFEWIGALVVLATMLIPMGANGVLNSWKANSTIQGDPDWVNSQIDTMLAGVAKLPPRTVILVDQWWQSPVISLFSGREDDFYDFRDGREVLASFRQKKRVYFLLTYHEKMLDPRNYQRLFDILGPSAELSTDDYILSVVSPPAYCRLMSGQIAETEICDFMAATYTSGGSGGVVASWSPLIDFSKGDFQGQLCTGWYPLETADGRGFRWIWRHASCFLPNEHGHTKLVLSLYSLLDQIAAKSQTLTVLLNGRVVLTRDIVENRTVIDITAPLTPSSSDSLIVSTVTLRVDNVIHASGSDARDRGLIVSKIGFE